MRLVRYEHEGKTGIGQLTEVGVAPTAFQTLNELIAAGPEWAKTIDRDHWLSSARILAPTTNPSKILCCGVNYQDHIDENPAAVLPSSPFFFAKLPSAVIGMDDEIVVPYPEAQVDWEVELALIIGRTAKHVREEEALDYVFGYTVLNDVSGRDIQFKDQQITLGKGIDTFCPLGPVVVTADAVPDPQGLALRSWVNDQPMQNGSTANMIFPVAHLIHHLSRIITLYPGDVISTGTPAGVGTFRQPPVYLKPGDRVSVEVEGIGRLSNPVVAGW